MKCVILAGGKGTRLWPISRENMPKQFLKLCSEYTMLQETVLRNRPFADEFLIITGKDFVETVHQQMRQLSGVQYQVLLEPCGRNTAPAIAAACMLSDAEDILFVVPADADIQQGEAYTQAVMQAKQLAQAGDIVTFGIQPTHPHTGYGYISYEGNRVKAFKEKPSLEIAKQYLQQGGYLWNSGMFLFRAQVLLQELEKSRCDIYRACRAAMQTTEKSVKVVCVEKDLWQAIPAESIDYAVMEHSDRIAVVPSYFPWDDVGGLEALAKRAQNVSSADVLYQCENTQILNESKGLLVVAAGVSNLMIVATDDVIYVSEKGNSAINKNVLETCDLSGRK